MIHELVNVYKSLVIQNWDKDRKNHIRNNLKRIQKSLKYNKKKDFITLGRLRSPKPPVFVGGFAAHTPNRGCAPGRRMLLDWDLIFTG